MYLTNEQKDTITMEERSVTHGTFVIERSYPTTSERVFAAFTDPARKRRWFGEDKSRAAEEFEMDFRVGGGERSSYRLGESTPFPGAIMVNETKYLDIVPNRRLVIAYTMAFGDRRFSASLATFEFLPTDQGTSLIFTEQGAYFEGSDGAQMREAGWRTLLGKLAEELAR
jgi:uncharacterized protein YndB with AHSA1/START domain